MMDFPIDTLYEIKNIKINKDLSVWVYTSSI